MLLPKKVKHRKWQTARRGNIDTKLESRGTTVAFGSYGLKALSYGRITSNQIESARKAMSRFVKKVGRVWIRIFPDRPFTAKPPELGMGKGKGDPQGYCFEVYPGRILFEIDGLNDVESVATLVGAGNKMPIRTKVVKRK